MDGRSAFLGTLSIKLPCADAKINYALQQQSGLSMAAVADVKVLNAKILNSEK
jgi:hypothetical protein